MDYRLEQFRFELREDPSSRIFFKLGEHLRREGELQEAIAVLGNGLDQHPKYVAAWVSLGRALLDAGSSRQAADALARALALDPENAVASRHAGEAAIANGEWVEAIKALKRARALSAPDDALEERIAFVESNLADLGQLQAPAPGSKLGSGWTSAPPPGRSLDQVFADAEPDAPDASSGSSDGDVFTAKTADEVASDDPPVVEDFSRKTMAVPLSELPIPQGQVELPSPEPVEPEPDASYDFLDEFDIDVANEVSSDDGGAGAGDIAFDLDADAPPEPATPQDFEPETVFAFDDEPAVEDQLGVEDVAPSTLDKATVPVSAPEIEPAAAAEDDFDFDLEVDDETGARAEELPLPTMTLARLALDQADLELAEKTLQGVLERDPENAEASRLLAGLTAGAGGDAATSQADDATVDARARALQRWLEAVRLASERLKP